MSISFQVPDSDELDISVIAPHRILDATQFQDFRQKELDITRDAFQVYLSNYMAKEDEQWKNISSNRLPALSLPMKELEKNITKAADVLIFKQVRTHKTVALQAKKEKLSEEIGSINLKLDKFSKKKQDEESQQRGMEQQKAQLIEAINIKIFEKYEQPSVTNKSSILFNWIIGCLYGSKANVFEFCEQNKLQLQKPIPKPKPVVIEKTSFFACGGSKKPTTVPEAVQVFDDSFYAWQAVKKFIFQHDGADLLLKLKEFNALNMKPFQQMLTEELIYEKKSILSHVFEIDVKDQVRIFIELVESFLHILQNQKNTAGNAGEKQEIRSLFGQLKQKQSEEQTIKKQIEMLEKRQKTIKDLSEITTKVIHYIQNKIPEVGEKADNNDKEADTIKNSIQTLEQQVSQELYTLQEEQRQAANKLLEEKQKEQQRLIEEEHQKELQKLKDIEKQDQNNQSKQQSNEVVQRKDKPSIQEDQALEEPEESHHEVDNDMYNSDYDSDEDDGEEKKQLMQPESDPLRYNIQKTMFPHLLNNKQNNQKQKKTGGALFGNTKK